MNATMSPPVRFGPYAYDAETGELTRSGQRLALRPQAGQVLAYLAANAGRLVTREELSAHVWCAGTFVDFEHGLNLCIHEIRAALQDDANNPRYIETLPRRGYRFIGTIDSDGPSPPRFVPTIEPVVENQSGLARTEEKSAPRASGWRRRIAIAALLVALVTITLVSNRSGSHDTNANPVPARSVASVALLPLNDIGRRAEETWFADGVMWELQRQFESIDSLRTTALWSVLPYRTSTKSNVEIARELHVNSLVSGSVLHDGDRVRLNMKLADAFTGEPLWAQSYETTLADLPQTESEIAQAVAHALDRGSRAAVGTNPPRLESVNAEAHSLFLLAMNAQTTKELQRGLEKTIALDPQFALAWSMLADSYVMDTWFAQTESPMVGYPKAKELALNALAIDESDSSAHTTIAAVKLHHEWDWSGAEKEFKRAIELSPSDAYAHHIYSHYLLAMDRLSESVAESRIASDLNPLDPNLSTCVGWHCLYARQYDDAIAECLKLIDDQQAGGVTYYYLGRVYVRQGRLEEGIAALEIADRKAGGINSVLATLGYAYGRAGRRADAERVIALLEERAQRRYVAAFDIAVVYAGLGDADRTFEWLGRAFLERSTWLVHLKWDDRFAGMRSDPRMVVLLRKMGIPNPGSVRQPEERVPERYVTRVATK